jgi:hypothetical protein
MVMGPVVVTYYLDRDSKCAAASRAPHPYGAIKTVKLEMF